MSNTALAVVCCYILSADVYHNLEMYGNATKDCSAFPVFRLTN